MPEFTSVETTYPDDLGPGVTGSDTLALSYETWGYPDSPPAILIHGLGGDLRDWHAVANILSERYWVVAPDLRGHGRSAATDGPEGYSLDALTEDLTDLMDFLDIELAAVAGAGLGASVALNLALAAPARVPALVLTDLEFGEPSQYLAGDAGDAGDHRSAAAESFELDLVGRLGPAGLVGRLGPAGLGARLAKELRDPFLAGGIRSRYQRLSREGYLGGAAAQREAAARFSRGGASDYLTPTMPVLLCIGSEDPSRAIAAAFAEAAADGRCLIFDRCNRPLAVHCAEEFAGAVMAFFAEIEQAHDAQLAAGPQTARTGQLAP